MVIMVNIADLQDPNDPQGRSYRQVNAEKKHKISIGTLVEVDTGERLFVMKHTRDCDQTPLYSLGMKNSRDWSWNHGFGEESLIIIKQKSNKANALEPSHKAAQAK